MEKLALVFSGQGSQYVGMAKKLYEQYDTVRQTFNEAQKVLGFDLAKLCFEGNSKELTKTENTQPAILTMSVAQFRVYMEEFGVKPEFLAGHSLGEYAALVCAGAIGFTDALKIVRARGSFMQEAAEKTSGAMAAVKNIEEEIIEEGCIKLKIIGHIIEISNYNGKGNTVVSGDAEAVELLTEELKAKGAEVIKLNVSAAFHSPIMQEASMKLKNEIAKYNFNMPNFKVLSNVTARPYESKDDIAHLLSEQIIKPVRWREIMRYLAAEDTKIAIELGPKATLRNLILSNEKDIKAYSYDKEEDLKILNTIFEKEKAALEKKYSIIGRCLGIAAATKNYNYDNNEYLIGVTDPYEKLSKLHRELEETETDPTIEQMHMAVQILKTIFKTKGTPEGEQLVRLKELFKETGTEQYFNIN